MPRYFNDGIRPVSFVADEDLTAWQYKTVQLTASGGNTVEKCISASQSTPIGILQNDPSAGQEAAVKCIGFTKARCDINSTCHLVPGNLLMVACNSGGLMPVGTSGCAVVGRWVDELRSTSGSHIGNVLFYGIASDASGRTY